MEDTLAGSKNMSLENWENNPASLMYKMYVEKNYDPEKRGRYFCQVEDGKIILGFGINQWDKDQLTCLLATRQYLIRDKRELGKGKVFIERFPEIVSYMHSSCRELGYKAGLITHNEYNVWLRKSMEKDNERYKKEMNLTFRYYESPIVVNYTKQYASYTLYDESYETELLEILKNYKC
jgi:hypothetical protein